MRDALSMYAGPMPRRVVPISLRAEPALARAVEVAVVRHDEVRVAADEQPVRGQAVGLEAVHLLEQHLRVDDARRCR